MKEDFLHHLWKFRKFRTLELLTSNEEPLTVIHPGQYLQLAGPDFFNAQLIIGSQKWAGNIEIHVKSSDWYLHHHQKDPAYENVILHVVWEHDAEIFRSDNTEIPVLELKNYISPEILENYQSLILPKSWIFCERQVAEIDSFILKNWQERLFVERLEKKSDTISKLLKQTNNDWEAVLFCLIAKNFGLNTNGEIFLQIAQSLSFSIIRKENFEVENIEALLFGKAGLFAVEKQDHYFGNLKSRFDYLSHKYKMEKTILPTVQFFKHRPDNFPTIRLSQLANLYSGRQQLFSELIHSRSVTAIYELLKVTVSPYWQTHYQFDKESPKKSKTLSRSFVDLLLINTIAPIQFAYAKSLGLEVSEQTIELLRQVAAESNTIVDKFNNFGIQAENAFDTQSLLHLKSEYCDRGKCLDCAVGITLLKTN